MKKCFVKDLTKEQVEKIIEIINCRNYRLNKMWPEKDDVHTPEFHNWLENIIHPSNPHYIEKPTIIKKADPNILNYFEKGTKNEVWAKFFVLENRLHLSIYDASCAWDVGLDFYDDHFEIPEYIRYQNQKEWTDKEQNMYRMELAKIFGKEYVENVKVLQRKKQEKPKKHVTLSKKDYNYLKRKIEKLEKEKQELIKQLVEKNDNEQMTL